MKKFFLTTAYLGALALPAISLVNCIGTADQKEKDDQQVISLRETYRTSLNSTQTLDFETGEFYSAKQIGIDKVFGQEYRFEIQSYDDLVGQIVVNIHRDKTDGSSTVLKSDVKIIGFKKVNALDFISAIRAQALKQGELETTLIHNQKPSWFDAGGATYSASDLGIDHYFDFRQAEHQIKIQKQDDLVGKLEVIMVIKLGGKAVRLPLTIGGFLVDQNLRERTELVRKVLSQISDTETSYNDRTASDVIREIRDRDAGFWDALGIGQFPEIDEVKKHEIKILCDEIKPDDSKGLLTFKITLSFDHDGTTYSESKTVRISSFLEKDPREQNEDQIKAQRIKNYLEHKFVKTTQSKEKLPSEAQKNFRGNLTDLGLENLPAHLIEGVKLNFKVENPNDSKGTLILLVEIKVGKVDLNATLLIDGFKTSFEDQQEKARIKKWLDELITLIEQKHSQTRFHDKLPSRLGLETGVTFEKLGIDQLPDEIKQDAKITFELEDVNDDLGQVEVKVTASKQAISADRKIVIEGFRKNTQHLEHLWRWIQNQKTSLIDEAPSELLEKIGKVRGDQINFDQLGIKEPPEDVKSGVGISIVLSDFDDLHGKITVKLKLEIAQKKLEKEFSISGYKASAEAIRDELNQFAEAVEKYLKSKEGWSQSLPSELGSPGSRLPDLHYLDWVKAADSKGIRIELLIESTNDEQGTLTIKLRLEKKTLKLEDKLITISGLKTNHQFVENLAAKIRELNQADSTGDILVHLDQSSDWTEKDPREITLEEFETNLSEFKILLQPGMAQRVDLKWSLNQEKTTPELLAVSLQISRGQTSTTLEFQISGFKKLAQKLLDKFVDEKLTDKTFETAFSEELVELFKVGHSYTMEKLGIKNFDELDDLAELKDLELEFLIRNFDNEFGRITALMSITSDGYNRAKTVVIEGFWNKDSRQKTSLRIQQAINKNFGEFYFKDKLADLSEEDTALLFSYDQTSLKQFIGDSDLWNAGQKISLEQLQLVQKTDLLRQWVSQLGPKANLEFEIVEKPKGTKFYGSISVRPIIHYVDVEVSSEKPVIVSKFQSFELFFHSCVAQLSKKVSDQIQQGFRGSVVAFLDSEYAGSSFNEYPIREGGEGVNFLRNLSTSLLLNEESLRFSTKHKFGNYSLQLHDVLAKPIQEGHHHSFNQDRYQFEFLWGLGWEPKEHFDFNAKVWDHKLGTDENRERYNTLYRGKRSFTKTFTGFATHADIVSKTKLAYDQFLNKEKFLLPSNSRSYPNIKSVLGTIYGGHVSHSIDFTNPGAVNKWLRNLGRENHYFKYVKMPAGWGSLYTGINNSQDREIILSARPYFRFISADQRTDHAIMSFKVGFRFGRYSRYENYPHEWIELTENKAWHEDSDLKLIDTVMKLKVSE